MKILAKLYPFLMVIIFILGCGLSAKLSVPFVNNHFTYPVNESPYPKSYFYILVFTPDNVEEINLVELEEYKKEHLNYSFLVPSNKENFYKKNSLKT